jgi:hypothetical protein
MELSAINDKVLSAFAAALKDVGPVAKDKVADTGKYKYKYTDLSDVLDAVKSACHAQGLSLSQQLRTSDDLIAVDTMLFHESGEWIRFEGPGMRAQADPQVNGSISTYLRRYTLTTLFALSVEDDDGSRASRPAPARVDPMKARIDGLVEDMKALSETERQALKEWAASEGKGLSPKALAEDHDWLEQISAYLNEIVTA